MATFVYLGLPGTQSTTSVVFLGFTKMRHRSSQSVVMVFLQGTRVRELIVYISMHTEGEKNNEQFILLTLSHELSVWRCTISLSFITRSGRLEEAPRSHLSNNHIDFLHHGGKRYLLPDVGSWVSEVLSVPRLLWCVNLVARNQADFPVLVSYERCELEV